MRKSAKSAPAKSAAAPAKSAARKLAAESAAAAAALAAAAIGETPAAAPETPEAAALASIVVVDVPAVDLDLPRPGPKGGVPRTTVKPGASKLSGFVIVRNRAENPRRPGTYGNRAYSYLAPNVGAGVRYEDLRERIERDPRILGGLNHLAYDLAKGFTLAIPAAEFDGEIVAAERRP